MSCPDPNLLAALSEGTLGGEERLAVEGHVPSCEECREVLARLLAATGLAPGTRIGRFAILERIGAGAMGAVYAARDDELHRKVALKLLHANTGQERLVAEARAMARLAHPNVVPVLDLGADNGRLFLAMEFVEGVTLRRWLARGVRSTEEILSALREAGRGLEAAHAAGLTHRDFKPENVLVGDDGRVRVTDLGLARIDEQVRAPSANGDLRSTTEAAGTPAYMAPEQFRGTPAGPAADQFSFCVVLWEALCGEPPFDAGQPPRIETLASAVLAGRLRPPSGLRPPPPPWIRRLLARGLCPAAADRFPSMGALLDALSADARRSRRKRALAAVAAVAVAALSAGSYHLVQRRRQLCTGPGLESIWNPGKAEQVRAALAATGSPLAGSAWSRIRPALDGYGRDWLAMRTEACEATRVRGVQSEEVLDLRMACLAERRDELQAAVSLLAAPDRDLVERAAQVAAGLTPNDGCADLAALKAPLRPPKGAAERARVADARRKIALARTLEHSGRYREGVEAARSGVETARATGYRPVEAEALAQLGGLLALAHQPGFEETLEEAYYAAEASRHDEVAARASAQLVEHLGDDHLRRADAFRWAKAARAALTRSEHDYGNGARLEDALGRLYADDQDRERALASYQGALALQEKAASPDGDAQTFLIRMHIASALSEQGKLEQALAELDQLQAIAERTFGADHPQVADIRSRRSNVLSSLGRYPEALEESRGALAILERALGPAHPRVGVAHGDVGLALEGSGRFADALAELRQGIAIWEACGDRFHLGEGHNMIGVVLSDQEKYAEALAEFRRSCEILQTLPEPPSRDLAGCHGNIGDTLAEMGRHREGLAEQQSALAIFERSVGPEHPQTAQVRGGVGEQHLALGQLDEAADELGRAVAVLEAKAPNPLLLGEFRFALARALVKRDRARAVAVATQARQDTAGLTGRKKELQQIDAWLAAHR